MPVLSVGHVIKVALVILMGLGITWLRGRRLIVTAFRDLSSWVTGVVSSLYWVRVHAIVLS